MKILVTGGAGFIGSHLTEALVKRATACASSTTSPRASAGNLHAVRGDVEILRGDCADPAVARRAVKGVEVVFHEAAVPSVARSVTDPALAHRANATATLDMLLAARDAGVRRFIYAGSSSVYGRHQGASQAREPAPRPLSPYAVGKLAGRALPARSSPSSTASRP